MAKCDDGHHEIIYDSTLTLECPLCEALKEDSSDVMVKIHGIIDEHCLTDKIEDICNEIEVLL